MYLSPMKPKSCAGHNSHTVSKFDNIGQGHISGQVVVLRARKTTLALCFFLVISLNEFPSQILVHSIFSGLKCFDKNW